MKKITIIFLFTINSFLISEQYTKELFDCIQRNKQNFYNCGINKLNKIIKENIFFKNYLKKNELDIGKIILNFYPQIKFKMDIINRTTNDSLIKYAVVDTITYDCHFNFLINDSIFLSIFPKKYTCSCEQISIDTPDNTSIKNQTSNINIRIMRMKSLVFSGPLCQNFNDTIYVEIIGFSKLSYLTMQKLDFFDDCIMEHIDDFNEVKNIYTDEWINYCGRLCSIEGVPWWRFWDWSIFVQKPKRIKKIGEKYD